MCSAAYLLKSPTDEVVKGRKPHTKLQQRCLDLQKTLPPITEAQLRWGKSKIPKIGFYTLKGRGGRNSFVWCQECGQMDEVGLPSLYVDIANPKHTCSRCGKQLELRHWRLDRKQEEENYPFAVITTCKEFQVARVFNIHRWNMMGYDTIENIQEVFSIWFDMKKFKETIVTKPYTRGWNHFRWRTIEPMKIGRHNGGCAGYYIYDDLYNLHGYDIYPRMKVQPLLKRNGWSNKMAKMKTSPVEIWRTLLTDPAAEGLAKNGQYAVLDHWFNTGGPLRNKSSWLPLVKICNRRKYIIKDASLWFDVVDSLTKLGMDTHSPKYICPDDLNAMHDWLQRKIDYMNIREELRKLKSNAKNWEQFYAESKGRFFPITFNDGRIFCHVVKSVEEMCEEGTRMHHCVFRMGYYKKPESLILSARDRNGDRLETVEVSLKTFKVVQSRGLQNRPSMAHDRIIALVNSNMNLIKQACNGKRRTRKATRAACRAQ